MKKKLSLLLALSLISTSMFAGCGASTEIDDTNVSVATEALTATSESTEIPHEHAYTEVITTEASCETDGLKTFTCVCGDSYTETITATGHVFENYVSNEDATYLADGTETAKCNGCELTDTRTAEGSMLTYTYTDMDATMYAQNTVNVRNLPNSDGEKLDGLSTNDEVKVTGQCVETNWYRIEFDGNVAYVSNDYLGNDKVVVQAQTTQSTSSSGYSIVLKSGYSYVNTTVSSYDEAVAAFKAVGIEPWVVYEENGTRWCYAIICHAPNSNNGNHSADFDAHIGGHYYWGNLLGTKDGRVYVEDVNGGSWSIRDCYGDIF